MTVEKKPKEQQIRSEDEVRPGWQKCPKQLMKDRVDIGQEQLIRGTRARPPWTALATSAVVPGERTNRLQSSAKLYSSRQYSSGARELSLSLASVAPLLAAFLSIVSALMRCRSPARNDKAAARRGRVATRLSPTAVLPSIQGCDHAARNLVEGRWNALEGGALA